MFIMGPTGTGKTRLALALGSMLDIEIVSVDSALVYRGLDIGTAKPNPELRRRVPHHLIDICAASAPYSAAQFRGDALAAIAGIRARGRLPVLVGGTGLYFRALEQGLSVLPPANPALRAELQAELERSGAQALHQRLHAVDPRAAARIHPHDPQRLLRALEVHSLSGTPMSALWELAQQSPLNAPVLKLVLAPPERTLLHRRLAARFHDMLERGFVNEVRALRAGGTVTRAAPSMRTVGYREVWRYLDGELTRGAMIERGIVATRQLAKRQLTWLRRESGCLWLDSERPDIVAVAAALIRKQVIFKDHGSDLE